MRFFASVREFLGIYLYIVSTQLREVRFRKVSTANTFKSLDPIRLHGGWPPRFEKNWGNRVRG